MWFVWLSIGACIGVLAAACCMAAKRREADCFNCTDLIEANQTIAGRDGDIKALLERIGTLERANAALRGINKSLEREKQTIMFLKTKEA
jgi:hypothetical protein